MVKLQQIKPQIYLRFIYLNLPKFTSNFDNKAKNEHTLVYIKWHLKIFELLNYILWCLSATAVSSAIKAK